MTPIVDIVSMYSLRIKARYRNPFNKSKVALYKLLLSLLSLRQFVCIAMWSLAMYSNYFEIYDAIVHITLIHYPVRYICV